MARSSRWGPAALTDGESSRDKGRQAGLAFPPLPPTGPCHTWQGGAVSPRGLFWSCSAAVVFLVLFRSLPPPRAGPPQRRLAPRQRLLLFSAVSRNWPRPSPPAAPCHSCPCCPVAGAGFVWWCSGGIVLLSAPRPAWRRGRGVGTSSRAGGGRLLLFSFLQQEARWAKRPCRFDVVTVDTSDGQSPPRLDWIQNAFDA